MYGVIPAAGRGSRLGSLTDNRPKPLVDVAGKPLLRHVFDALEPHVDEFVVVIGYRGEQIRDRFGETSHDTPITYVEQAPRRGLAEALLRAQPAIDGPFVQLNADNVLRGNIGDLLEHHRKTAADATLLVERVSRERARRGGVIEYEDDDVVGLVEKPTEPPGRLSNTGCFAFSPRIFDGCRSISPSERGEYELADAITWLLDRGGRVECVTLDGWRVNVNTPADVRRAERRLLK